MVGPSSSHTAGACRIGLIARALVGGTPDHALVELHGSFARTGVGHGTDRAIAGGLLGYQPDDERLRESLDAAAAAGLAGDHHPNTTRIHVTRAGRTAVLTGSSLGAGRIMVTAIDGFPVEITGAYTTLVAVAKDVPGIVASVAGALADDAVNLATMRVSRRQRGGDAIHIYELDHAPTDEAMTRIRAMPVMKTVRIIERVS